MAGHIQDRWYKTEKGPDGKPHRVRTDRYGTGKRYRARYEGPDGKEKSRSFPDRQKRQAENWLIEIAADMSRGTYTDPRASRLTFRQFAENWLSSHQGDTNERGALERHLRLHVFEAIGSRPLVSFQPGHVRTWLTNLPKTAPAASYQRIIYGTVSTVFSAAVDDGLILKNPCRVKSVRMPKAEPTRVVPWTPDQVFAVQGALPERFRTMVDLGGGCGLRQGEIFGLPVEAIGFDSGWLAVRQQLKRVRGKFVFALPKRGKVRDVPLPPAVAAALREHMKRFPPVEITLPWGTLSGPPVTRKVVFMGTTQDFVRPSHFDDHLWKPALAAAGIIPEAGKGERYKSAREHGMHALRHFYASVLLDAGENVRALSQYLGHEDPGFTLRVYTHLMPSSESRTRNAVDGMYRAFGKLPDGPETAPGA
ncbi:tyrosine-type recombinase/integrase [Kitasatospora sp. NPDC004669]|uniref:tyrosine-type recombinase/integrase n=1 Tax=Kitasatospora sp. NPDC004669 TaxID=3154555 RepID=UPI0033BC0906